MEDAVVVGLIAKLGDAAAAVSTAAVALANAASVGSSANQTTGGAGAGTAGAASNMVGSGSQVQLDADIGTTEAYTHNLKRTVDLFQTLDVDSIHKNRQHFDNAVAAYQTHVTNVNALNLNAIKDAQVASKIGDDRLWNVNATDAYETILASKIAEAVKGALKEAAKAA